MKTCKKCGLDKPLTDYTVDTRYKDGHYPWCAACRRAWRQSRKEKQLSIQRDWRQENLDHAREYGRDYYHEHKEKIVPIRRAYDRKRWKSDPAVRRRKNDQKLRAYYENPKQRTRILASARFSAYRRRARKQALTEHFTADEWQALCEQYDHKCLKCGRNDVPMTPDHIIPLSRCGADDISNIQPLCLPCNLSKNAKTADYRPMKQAALLDGENT